MNIWDLEIGDKGLAENGKIYTVVNDTREHRPTLGVVPIRVCKDNEGLTAKFITGIEVTKL